MSAPRARRIHGRHPLLAEGGAAVDDDLAPEIAQETGQRWLERARQLAAPLGLEPPALHVLGGHVSLVLPAPMDARDLAADLLDQAVGNEPESPLSFTPDPALRHLVQAARRAEIPAFLDEDVLVLGLGAGARVHPRSALPSELGDAARIPFVLVTGTNGKTTTANLLGSIAAEAGFVPGVATSTGIRVGSEQLEEGDWSGPGAARILGRDPRVTLAVLETARGGLLRRGLLVEGADVAVITNISDDHLGDWGLTRLEELARVKRLVAESLRWGGTVVTRADDTILERCVQEWHAQRPDVRWLRFSSAGPADAWRDGDLLRFPGGSVPVRSVPLTLAGAARHNVENALCAAAAAVALGISADAITRGLCAIEPKPGDNPGRSNLFLVGQAQVLVDYAHNPDGLMALAELVDALQPLGKRRMLLGQAGDRPPELVLALARAAARVRCATYVIKPLPGYARGRDPEEVVDILYSGLREAGVPETAIVRADSEADGVRKMLASLQPGDLGLMLVHEDLPSALSALEQAGARPQLITRLPIQIA
jgi:cyanophycin synthetase